MQQLTRMLRAPRMLHAIMREGGSKQEEDKEKHLQQPLTSAKQLRCCAAAKARPLPAAAAGGGRCPVLPAAAPAPRWRDQPRLPPGPGNPAHCCQPAPPPQAAAWPCRRLALAALLSQQPSWASALLLHRWCLRPRARLVARSSAGAQCSAGQPASAARSPGCCLRCRTVCKTMSGVTYVYGQASRDETSLVGACKFSVPDGLAAWRRRLCSRRCLGCCLHGGRLRRR
jgi:hypothetical protein